MNGKLYLNLTHGINNAFIRSAKRSIKTGDRYWAKLSQDLNTRVKDSYWGD